MERETSATEPERDGFPTVDPETMESLPAARRGRVGRRIAVTLVGLVVLMGAGNMLGNTVETARAAGGGFEIALHHPGMARAGLSANWEATIRRLDGESLPSRLELVSDRRYFDLFDENGFSPTPLEEWQESDRVTWVFRPPDGATELTVSLDARLQPDVHRGRSGYTTLVVGGDEVVSVAYSTGVAP